MNVTMTIEEYNKLMKEAKTVNIKEYLKYKNLYDNINKSLVPQEETMSAMPITATITKEDLITAITGIFPYEHLETLKIKRADTSEDTRS